MNNSQARKQKKITKLTTPTNRKRSSCWWRWQRGEKREWESTESFTPSWEEQRRNCPVRGWRCGPRPNCECAKRRLMTGRPSETSAGCEGCTLPGGRHAVCADDGGPCDVGATNCNELPTSTLLSTPSALRPTSAGTINTHCRDYTTRLQCRCMRWWCRQADKWPCIINQPHLCPQ